MMRVADKLAETDPAGTASLVAGQSWRGDPAPDGRRLQRLGKQGPALR